MMDAYRIAIMSPEPSATNSVIAGYRTGLTMWNYMKGKMSSDTGVNISGNAATATSAGKLSTGRERSCCGRSGCCGRAEHRQGAQLLW